MKIEDIINGLAEKYYDMGYRIVEICLPKEFKDELASFLPPKNDIDIYQTDHCVIKLFENQSKHLNIIIRPIRMTKSEIEDRAKRVK